MKFALTFLATLIVSFAVAQVETPPNEPPYTDIEEEFDQAAQGERTELRAGAEESAVDDEPAVIEAPPPPPMMARPESQEDPMVSKSHAGGKTYIRHPMASKGLKLIDRDGSYYYVPKKYTNREQTTSFRFGALTPSPAITAADGSTSYTTMYGSAQPAVVMFEYEWKPWRGFGDIGLQLGGGFFTAQGQGRFVCPDGGCNPDETEAREKYTFYAIPLVAGLIYRFQYTDGQWIAPYVSGGLTYYGLLEMRDDNKTPNMVGTPSVYGAGGLMFNLSAMDESLGFSLDSEYGISTMWLSLEARQIQATNKDIDLGGTLLSLGISVDY